MESRTRTGLQLPEREVQAAWHKFSCQCKLSWCCARLNAWNSVEQHPGGSPKHKNIARVEFDNLQIRAGEGGGLH